MAQVRDILVDIKKIDSIESSLSQLQTDVTNFDALPSQAGNIGKYLKTDGSVATWEQLPAGYTDSDVGAYLSAHGYGTTTSIIASITNSAPSTLDTLKELATALGDDPNFATTITNSIAGKINKSGGTFTGNVAVNGILEVKNPSNGNMGYMRVGTAGDGYPFVTIGGKMDTTFGATDAGWVDAWYLRAAQTLYISNQLSINNSIGTTNQVVAQTANGLRWSDLKTVNGNVIVGTGDITIPVYTDSNVASYLTTNGYVTTTTMNSALSLKADQSTTYTKSQVDSALSNKADTTTVNNALALKADQSTTYTKTQIDTSLGLKANQSTTYTKTETDTALGLKANQSTTYTKTEVDTSLGLKANLTDLTPTNVSDKSNTSTGYFSMPKGTTAQRPVSVDAGDSRFNITANALEVYNGSAWSLIGAKDGSSYAFAAPSATAIYDLGIRGKGLYWIQKADGTPIQVYCDLDTLGQDGKGGWMLVGSWSTASEWTKDSVSSSAVFGATALNAFSSNFGNTNMQHMRVKVATAVDLVPSAAEADWYYYWSSAIQWKTVWAAGAGTNNHWNSATGVNAGASTPRNSLRQFNFAYNLKWAYTANSQVWANLSDTGTSGTTGTEPWYDWYSGLTAPGYTLGVYNAGGSGRGDGSLAITFGGDTSTTAGHDCNYANAKYGYDDTGTVAWAGTSGSNNMNAQTGGQGANTNMWIWIK